MSVLKTLYPGFWSGRLGVGLLLLRLVFGVAFVMHGSGKIVHAFDWMGPQAPVPGFLQALAALSEFGGGIAMILGLLTPLAALGLIATMTFAVFMVHIPAGHEFVTSDPTKHSYEIALVYLVISLLNLLAGPGAYSVDAMLFSRNLPALQPNKHSEVII